MKKLESHFESGDTVFIEITIDELLRIENSIKHFISSGYKRFNVQYEESIKNDLQKILSHPDIEKKIIEKCDKEREEEGIDI